MKFNTLLRKSTALTLSVCLLLSGSLTVAEAQNIQNPGLESPDRKHVFYEDSSSEKRKRKKSEEAALVVDKSPSGTLDFTAPKIEGLKEANTLRGTGGAIITGQGVKAQAESATVNTQTKDAILEGNVLFSGVSGDLSADSAKVNLDSETGTFKNADFGVEEGDYQVHGEDVEKISEFDYKLTNASFSTCHCADSACASKPKAWSIECSSATITEEGYAHTSGTTLNFYGVPVLYSPYFVFPVKRDRATGLLAPRIGYGSKDGINLSLPLFVVLDDSNDILFRPFTQAQTRTGAAFDFRSAMSERSRIDSRFIFSDESARGDSLRGTIYNDPSNPGREVTSLSDLTSPHFDSQRFGVAYKQLWRSEDDATIPASFISDIHYVSDDLFNREIADSKIGDSRDPYTISQVTARVAPWDFLSAQVSGEYDQSLGAQSDKLLFKRIPEFSLTELKSFHPFGFNPYGVKLVTTGRAYYTDFSRDTGFEGRRLYVVPALEVPFHYGAYFNSRAHLGVIHRRYNLDNGEVPGSSTLLDTEQDKTIFNANYAIGTSFERVFQIEKDSLLTKIVDVGTPSNRLSLVRVKHVVEPRLSYAYVPEKDQSGIPIFDGLDHIRGRKQVTYSIKNRFYGKFLSPDGREGQIPDLSLLEEAGPDLPIPPFQGPTLSGFTMDDPNSAPRSFAETVVAKHGSIREFADLAISQSYDYDQTGEGETPWSNLGIATALYPSSYMTLLASTNYDTDKSSFASWTVGSNLRDPRGDVLRLRYSYLVDSFNQIEAQTELKITDQYHLAYYTRFDDQRHNFLENSVALRISPEARCWFADFGVKDTLNPNKETFYVTFTFAGLGDITQNTYARKFGDNSGGNF